MKAVKKKLFGYNVMLEKANDGCWTTTQSFGKVIHLFDISKMIGVDNYVARVIILGPFMLSWAKINQKTKSADEIIYGNNQTSRK